MNNVYLVEVWTAGQGVSTEDRVAVYYVPLGDYSRGDVLDAAKSRHPGDFYIRVTVITQYKMHRHGWELRQRER